MASNKRGKQKTATNVATAPPTMGTTQSNKGEINMALSHTDIAELLAGSRNKGGGTDVIRAFLESGEAGIEVDLKTGPLAGKEPGSAYTTLTNAKKRTTQAADGSTVLAMPEAKNVRVIKRNLGTKDAPDFHVFLVDTSKIDLDA